MSYERSVREFELAGSKLNELTGNINQAISLFLSFFTGQSAEERLNKVWLKQEDRESLIRYPGAPFLSRDV